MKKAVLARDLFLVAILTVMTVFLWIGLDTYRALNKKEVPKILQKQIEPLNPELDQQTLKNLSDLPFYDGRGFLLLPTNLESIEEATLGGQL